MMAKPTKTRELHYPMIQLLIKTIVLCSSKGGSVRVFFFGGGGGGVFIFVLFLFYFELINFLYFGFSFTYIFL